ncbi:MAG: hypothetical protein WA960_06065 [Tunicatimonas sp.]
MMRKVVAAINTFPGRTCLFTLFINVLLFGLGYGGAASEEILAPFVTINLLIYAVGAGGFLRRFMQTIDHLNFSESLFETALLLGILFIGFFNFLMFYLIWSWVMPL